MLSRAAEPFDRVFEYWPGLILGVIVCGAAIALPIAQSRVLRVLVLGACGFTVVGMYIVYKAPDLALTQLMFEIISVFLFLLVLRLLPRPVKSTPGGRTWRAAISLAVGVVFAVMTLVAAPSPERSVDVTPLGEGLAQTSYEPHPDPETGYAVDDERGGGGKNIVNVILVDFRGFDTLGEITVLCLAAMGVWSMIPRRRRGSPTSGRMTRRRARPSGIRRWPPSRWWRKERASDELPDPPSRDAADRAADAAVRRVHGDQGAQRAGRRVHRRPGRGDGAGALPHDLRPRGAGADDPGAPADPAVRRVWASPWARPCFRCCWAGRC